MGPSDGGGETGSLDNKDHGAAASSYPVTPLHRVALATLVLLAVVGGCFMIAGQATQMMASKPYTVVAACQLTNERAPVFKKALGSWLRLPPNIVEKIVIVDWGSERNILDVANQEIGSSPDGEDAFKVFFVFSHFLRQRNI